MGVVSHSSTAIQDDSRAQPKPVSHPSVSPNPAATSGKPDSDKYVDKLLHNAVPLPPITWSNWYREIRWFNLSVIIVTPLIALYGALTTRLETRTLWYCVFYYVFNMIGGLLGCFWAMSFRLLNPVGDPQELRLVGAPTLCLRPLIMTCMTCNC